MHAPMRSVERKGVKFFEIFWFLVVQLVDLVSEPVLSVLWKFVEMVGIPTKSSNLFSPAVTSEIPNLDHRIGRERVSETKGFLGKNLKPIFAKSHTKTPK